MSSDAPTRCILYERTGLWAAALRWEWGAGPLPLQEVRSLIDARTLALAEPQAAVLLEADARSAEGVLRLLLELRLACPEAHLAVLLAADAREFRESFREAGASWLVESPGAVGPLVRAMREHLTRQQPEELDDCERIRRRLPWGDADTHSRNSSQR